MAHELEQHGTEVAFVDTRDDAWHRLNNLPRELVGTPLTAEVALKHAHLAGWNLRKVPSMVMLNGELVPTGSYTVVRDNPFTGAEQLIGSAVGEQWQPFHNEELTDFLDALVHETHGNIETAGSMRGGREVFVTTKMPEGMKIGGVDQLDLFIAAVTSHDGSRSTRFYATEVRTVCKNTQRRGEASAVGAASIRHTSGQTGMVEKARQQMGLAIDGFSTFQAEAEAMIQQTQTEAEFIGIIDGVFGKLDPDAGKRTVTSHKKRTDKLVQLWADADTQANIRGTAWAGLQAITEYLDHMAPVQGGTESAAIKRAERSILGGDQPLRDAAWNLSRVLTDA
jgi:phage/plasmid-like protein (TIGR03299 family)